MNPLYLDHNATTPLHPRVREAMSKALGEELGNPSSPHTFGRRARDLVECAREEVATFLGVDGGEVFFTSGGTESNNLFLYGANRRQEPVYVTATDHPSLLEPAKLRWRGGAPGGRLPVDE